MRTGVVTSVVVHVALLLWYFVSVGAPRPFDAVPVEPMTVDLVAPEQVDRPPNQVPSELPIAELSPLPVRQLGPDNKPSAKPPSIPAGVQHTLSPESQSAASSNSPQGGELVLGPRIVEPLQYSTPAELAEAQSAGFDAPAESATNLSADEIAAFRAQVQKCWKAPAAVTSTEKLHVVMRVALARNGSLTTRPSLIEGSASPHGPALMESAIRALHQCQPYGLLPAGKYNEWKVLDLTFSPSGVSGG
jgi:hypothetical protein